MATLTELRKTKRWSQAELGRRSGIHPASISQIESGRLRPYPGQMRKLSEALSVPLSELAAAFTPQAFR